MNEHLVVDGFRLVSNSEVQTFKDCPRKWWLSWYLGLTPRKTELAGVRKTGDRVHIALAALYTPNATHDDCLDALEEVIAADGRVAAATGQFTKELKNQFDLERAMVEGYLQWITETGIDAQLEVLASETYVEAVLPSIHTPVKLIGKIDAEVRNHATREDGFIDHKTAASTVVPGLRLNEQKLHYHLVHFLARPDAERRLSFAYWNVLKRVKRTVRANPPFYARHPVPVNQYEVNSYNVMVTGTVIRMLSTQHSLDMGEDHHLVAYRRFSETCSWKCPFIDVCPLFDDGSNVWAAVDDLFVARDPLSYYGGREKESE